MKVSLKQRLVFAYKAFMLQPFTFYLPFEKNGRPYRGIKIECDNHYRSSRCHKEATKALTSTLYQFGVTKDADLYLVCDDCEKKYLGKLYKETF